ncbi:unknown [Roseburia sp. CAG:100]|nr:unknown [Roseburia sp. CAG:100]
MENQIMLVLLMTLKEGKVNMEIDLTICEK